MRIDNPRLKILRKIHPVGQGAMYSETFYEDEAPRTTVLYDCGTKSKTSFLEKEINSLERADYLFISHFHHDHISGVETLIRDKGLKQIYIPHVTPFHFLLDVIYNSFTYEAENTNSIDFMLRTLPVLSGKNDDEESDVEIRVVNGDNVPMDGFPYVTCWRYDIIQSSCESEQEYNLVSELCNLLSIDLYPCLSDFQSEVWYRKIVDALRCDRIRKEIKKLYLRKFPGGHNSYSMMVHSHRCGVSGDASDIVSNDFSCLYTGDAELKDNNSDALEIRKLAPQYIQVPHHGSYKNHNLKIYQNNQIAFVSVGEKPPHRHPSPTAINEIINTCADVNIVTENGSAFEREFILA